MVKKIDIEELYWIDWNEISRKPEELNEIFAYIRDYDSRNIEELGKILKLYSNPSGEFTIEFAKIAGEIYKNDKIKFIKALNLVRDEAINLVYVFRMEKIFEDEDKEYTEILSSNQLTEEEIDTTYTFFKMYKTICAT